MRGWKLGRGEERCGVGCIDQGWEGERLINCLRLSGTLPPFSFGHLQPTPKTGQKCGLQPGHQKPNRSEKAKKRHRSGFTGGQPILHAKDATDLQILTKLG